MERKGKDGGGDGWGNDYQMVFYYCVVAATTTAASSFKAEKTTWFYNLYTVYYHYTLDVWSSHREKEQLCLKHPKKKEFYELCERD